jgi:kynureninase
MDDLERWRDEFPILAHTVYMISNSLGAMPRRTAQNLAAYADAWATRGVRAWEERWWEMPLEVGNRIARIIGAPDGSVSMHENVTTAHLVALSCQTPSGARRRIVCSAMDFPSMVYLFRAQEANGFELRVVPPGPAGPTGPNDGDNDLTNDTARLLDAIDDTTAVVAISHVLFRKLYIVEAAEIARSARRTRRDQPDCTSRSASFHRSRRSASISTSRLPEMAVGAGHRIFYTRPTEDRAAIGDRLAVAPRLLRSTSDPDVGVIDAPR